MKNFNWSKLVFFTAMITLSLSGFPITFTSAFGQTSEVFRITDGYFLGGNAPVHLIHDDAKPEVDLGDNYNLSLSFKINQDIFNPCSRREEKPCHLIQQVIVKHDDGSEEFVAGWKNGLELRVDGVMNLGFPDTLVPRTAPTGDAVLVVKIIKESETIFRKEWPMKIW